MAISARGPGMTTLDILFWLLAALLGGCIWAIEAGLAARHRTVLLSSMASTLLTMLILMFFVDDPTKLKPFDAEKFAKQKSGPAVEKEPEDDGPGEREGGGNDNGGGSGRGEAKENAGADGKGSAAGNKGAGGDAAAQTGNTSAADENEGSDEYSRTPFKDCPVCPDVVIVPKGVAHVGAADDDPHRQPNERPMAVIPMANPLAVGRLEIQRREYAAFAQATGFVSQTACNVGKKRGRFTWERPGFEQDERHPVTCLTWPEIRLYLAWLSEKAGRTYRLPTEAEWEHAARAGTETPYWMGAMVTRYSANIAKSRDGTTVGGSFAQNQWGLSDVAGNLWEMTSQCAYDHARLDAPPADAGECRRVLKGGAWSDGAVAARHAARRFIVDGQATNDIGFRVVREVDERDDHRRLTVEQRKALQQDARIAAEIAERARAAAEEAVRKRLEDAEKAIATGAAGKK